MDLGGWRIAGIQHIRPFSGEDEGTDKALKFAYGSLSLPPPPATPDAPLAAWSGAPDDGVDRISRLPDEILRNVVARLPGCRENPLWRPGLEDTLGVTNEVSDILAAHPGPFRCVHITCCYLDMNREKINGWLKLVTDKSVQELAFINRPWPLDLRLPTTLFSCTSLTRLHIGAWKLPNTATLPDAVAFPHLQELFLTLITMKDQDLAFLLERSPALDVLTIIASQRDVRLCLLGMSSLGDITVADNKWAKPITPTADAPRLERFFLLMTRRIGGNKFSRIKIGNAPNLRLLGYWPPGQHELQIGNTIIEVSPCTIIPSVKILALQVHFEVRNEVKTVPAFLKCFPNVETLHIQSVKVDRPTGNVSLKFWQEACPVGCLQHVKKLGSKNEHAFIKFVAERAYALKKMVVFLCLESFSSSNCLDSKMRPFCTVKCVSKDIKAIHYGSRLINCHALFGHA
ncbi:hypothetical protein PVAP13_5KG393800 [Panicum virgatum]|uniref:F-box/LRR-repeat protein 15/At3g58940/PEG3-like LRR domain-containing protein n=1 Tax=Panicum virgatum TaxID=38727 RepID=A0A8T0SNW0_PANVG|nr:hypothetical protein PVAP13_5KG393800 [Panicum virgatum]